MLNALMDVATPMLSVETPYLGLRISISGQDRSTITSLVSIAVVACSDAISLVLLLKAYDVVFSRDEGVKEIWAINVKTSATPRIPSCDHFASPRAALVTQYSSSVQVGYESVPMPASANPMFKAALMATVPRLSSRRRHLSTSHV